MDKRQLHLLAGIMFYISSLSFLLIGMVGHKFPSFGLFLGFFSLGTLNIILYKKNKDSFDKN
jgi:hypothetical protein